MLLKRSARTSYSLFAAGLLLVTACSGTSGTEPRGRVPGLRVVSGGSPPPDTIGSVIDAPLVVEWNAADGSPIVGSDVLAEIDLAPGENLFSPRRMSVGATQSSNCAFVNYGGLDGAKTDASGQVRFCLRRELIAGNARVSLRSLSRSDTTSASFLVAAGRSVGLAVSPDTAVMIGSQTTLRASLVDRAGNRRFEVATPLTSGANLTLVPGAQPTVAGVAFGAQWVQLVLDAFRDSTLVNVVPAGRVLAWNFDAKTVQLWNMDGSTVRDITPSSLNTAALPRFDFSRSRALFISDVSAGLNNSIVIVDTTGANRRTINQRQTIDRTVAMRSLADGSLLVVATPAPTSPFLTPADLRVWRVATDSTISELARIPDAFFEQYTADISPNGAQVAYIAFGPAAFPELRVLDIATGASRALVQKAYAPRWSSTGDRLAYLSTASATFFPANTGELMTIRADGTSPRNLSGTRKFSPGLTWSPDDSYVMGRQVEGGWRMYRLSDGAAAGIPLRTRSGAPFQLLQPDWR